MKKLTALLLALIMVLAMNASALAETIGSDGIAGDTSSAISTIDFEVKYNVESGVDAPLTKFSYELTNWDIADGHAGIVLFAGTATSPEIRNGNGSAYLPTADVTVDENNSGIGKVTINTGSYTQPGVYRYKLTQKPLTTTQTNAGVMKADEYDFLVLDVYVTKVGDPAAPAVTAVVLHKDNVAVDDNADKVAGFNNTYSPNNPDPGTSTPDPTNPESYELTITKKVDGSAASNDQEFDFTIVLTPPTNDDSISFENVKVGVVATGVNTNPASELTLNNGANTTLTVKMKHDSKIVIKGVPQNTTVSVTEDHLDYTPENTVTEMTAVDAKTGKETGTYKTTSAANDIAFKNTRKNISPTGVVLRVAPYAIMLGAGVVLFIILKSRKNKAVEEA